MNCEKDSVEKEKKHCVVNNYYHCGCCSDTDIDGGQGWTPVLAIVEDVERRVQQVTDWTGGTGEKPVSGQYVGIEGFVESIEEAVDIRGQHGIQGEQGIQGERGIQGEQGIQGERGIQGEQGIQGEPGSSISVESNPVISIPVGAIVTSTRTEEIIVHESGTWIKADDIAFEIKNYPDAVGLNGMRRSIVPLMTSDKTPAPFVASGTVITIQQYNPAYWAFNGTQTEREETWAANTFPAWIKIDLTEEFKDVFTGVKIISYSVEQTYGLEPKNFSIEASNNNSTWTKLLTLTNQTNWTTKGKTYSWANDTAYRYYRLNISADNGYGAVFIDDIEFIGSTFYRSPRLPLVNGMYQYIKIKDGITLALPPSDGINYVMNNGQWVAMS